MITNLKLNYRHQLKKLAKDKIMKPQQRIWRYTHGSLVGRGLITDHSILGCFEDYQVPGKLSAGISNYRN